MRPTIRPTAAEMEETDRINEFCFGNGPVIRNIFYDWQNDEEIEEARTGRHVSITEYAHPKDCNEYSLIGLQMEESYWGEPKFILEE